MSAPLSYQFQDKNGTTIGAGYTQMRYWIPPQDKKTLALEGLNILFDAAAKAETSPNEQKRLAAVASIKIAGNVVSLEDVREAVTADYKDPDFSAHIKQRAEKIGQFIPSFKG